MLQFYFLSVFLNFVAGLIFIFNATDEVSGEEALKEGGIKSLAVPFLSDKTLQLVVGILSALTGLMKLLSPIQYDIVVIGDLIPSLAGLASGCVLLLDWYQNHSEIELNLPESIENIYTGGRKYLGVFCVIAAFLHFVFPRVLFL